MNLDLTDDETAALAQICVMQSRLTTIRCYRACGFGARSSIRSACSRRATHCRRRDITKRRVLQAILPKESPIVSEALSVAHRGCELFDLMCKHDLEGIVTKRLADPYDARVKWHKIKNRGYTQKEGRSDLFNGPRQASHARPMRRAGSTSVHGYESGK